MAFHINFLFALSIFTVTLGKQTEKPYLLGYHSSEADNKNMEAQGIIPDYVEFPNQPREIPEWKIAIKDALEHSGRGDHFTAISTIEGLVNSPYNYGRMGSTARYSLHFSLGMCLLHGGFFNKAESAFYIATSLHDEPHEAHKGLALVSVQSGRWEDAFSHWKNCLFLATSQDSEYLQRLGALLILAGRLNEGRHYLSRAVSQWELAQGPGASLPSFHIGPKEYAWFVEYLVGTTSLSWPPHGRFDNDVQSPHEWRLLSQLVADPSLLDAAAFLQLSDMLFDLGAYPESKFHLKHAMGLARDKSLLVKAELRAVLRVPWACERSSGEETIHILPPSINTDTLTSVEMIELQKYTSSLVLSQINAPHFIHASLSAHSKRLREHQSLTRPCRPLHIGILCGTDDLLLLATIPTLKRRGLHITIFSNVHMSSPVEGVEVEMLPMGDWWLAASVIRSRLLSVVLFSDSCGAYFSLITSQRVATHHVAVWDRGLPPQSHTVDYYVKPEYMDNADLGTSQLVTVTGLGVPWASISSSFPDASSPRYEFHGLVFFNYMHLVLVTAPFSEYTAAMDDWIVALLQTDPQIHVLLLVSGFDLGGRAFPSQWHNRYLHHVRSKLGGDRDAQARLKLMPYLDLKGRLELAKISKAVLDCPRGGTSTVLEALSVGTPVLTPRHALFASHFYGGLKDHLNSSEAEELDRFVFSNVKELTLAAKHVIGDNAKRSVRKGFDGWATGDSALSSDIAAFVGEELSVV